MKKSKERILLVSFLKEEIREKNWKISELQNECLSLKEENEYLKEKNKKDQSNFELAIKLLESKNENIQQKIENKFEVDQKELQNLKSKFLENVPIHLYFDRANLFLKEISKTKH